MFAHRLALAFGEHDPDRLLASMSSVQFTRWIAYFECEPFGDRVIHHMLAQLLYFSYAQVRAKDGPDLRPVDFTPGLRPVETVNVEERESMNVREFVKRGF